MARHRFTQSEARALARRVADLEGARDKLFTEWATQTYPGGVHIASVTPNEVLRAQVKTARRLGHAVVATVDHSGGLDFYAMPSVKPSP